MGNKVYLERFVDCYRHGVVSGVKDVLESHPEVVEDLESNDVTAAYAFLLGRDKNVSELLRKCVEDSDRSDKDDQLKLFDTAKILKRGLEKRYHKSYY